MVRPQVVGIVAMLVVGVGAGFWWENRSPQPVPVESPAVGHLSPVVMITVHVAGWVSHPGLVEVNEGARVADAIVGAGGLLPGANVDAINLAASLSDGEQVVVPGPEEQATPSGHASADGKVHLNTATAAELDALPGVGPVIAARIIAYRTANGPFATVEDLLDVSGIGESKLASIRELIAVP